MNHGAWLMIYLWNEGGDGRDVGGDSAILRNRVSIAKAKEQRWKYSLPLSARQLNLEMGAAKKYQFIHKCSLEDSIIDIVLSSYGQNVKCN